MTQINNKLTLKHFKEFGTVIDSKIKENDKRITELKEYFSEKNI